VRGPSTPGTRLLVACVFSGLACASAALGIDYSACAEDPTGDVCYGTWDLFGAGEGCRYTVERPEVDIIGAETWDDLSHVLFRIRLKGEAVKSTQTVYGFRGATGEGFLGMTKHLNIWVIDGTAYLMTDMSGQLFPVRESRATTMEGDLVTVRIPKPDIGDCTRWEMSAFAFHARGDVSPGAVAATAYHDDVELDACPIGECAVFGGLAIFVLLLRRSTSKTPRALKPTGLVNLRKVPTMKWWDGYRSSPN
jgi:hypothetical protein